MSTKVLKDEALETYYSGLFGTYGTPGWKALMEDTGRMLEIHNNLAGVDTEQQLWFRKGELAMMSWLLAHQSTAEAAYAGLIAEQEGGDDEPGTGGIARVIA